MLAFCLCVAWSEAIDPRQMRELGAFSWDQIRYKEIFDQLLRGSQQLQGEYPYSTRVLLPALSALLARRFGWGYAQASDVINLVALALAGLYTLFFLQRHGVGRLLAWVLTLIPWMLWHGPLRQTLVFPGALFGLDCLIFCGLHFVLTALPSSGWIGRLLAFFAAFILTTGREAVWWVMLLLIVGHWALVRFAGPYFAKWHITPVQWSAALGSLFAVVVTRQLVSPVGEPYHIGATVLTFGWFQLNVIEFVYPYFLALGPLMLVTLVVLTLGSLRSVLLGALSQHLAFPGAMAFFCSLARCSLFLRARTPTAFYFGFTPFLRWSAPMP